MKKMSKTGDDSILAPSIHATDKLFSGVTSSKTWIGLLCSLHETAWVDEYWPKEVTKHAVSDPTIGVGSRRPLPTPLCQKRSAPVDENYQIYSNLLN